MADTHSILIVDDELPQMRALCDTLQDRGFETVGCSLGSQALARLGERRFDLLLSDLMMPEMDGISLLQAALKLDPDLVAIIMTGAGTIATAVEAMKAGALDYILKPFKLSEILPVLSRALTVRQLRLENAALEKRVKERTDELELVNRELKSFSYSVSHDLRAPLRIITGYVDILVTDHSAELSPAAAELMKTIVAQTRTMDALIEGLLRFSHLGRQPLETQVVAVPRLVGEILGELRTLHRDRQVEVTVGELPDCLGDLALVRQVFANVLSNAFKYTARTPAPAVAISGRIEDDFALYAVRDNGVGFKMKDAEKLFQMFRRLHSQSDFEGNGIGLSIVQRIIQRHGGRIWAEAAPQAGATFTFTLPRSP
jgi:signal transduction histidine kinase